MKGYHYPDVDWDRLRSHRTGRILEILTRGDLEAAVISDTCNVRYVADVRNYGAPEIYSEIHFVVLTAGGDIHLFTQILFEDMPKRMPWITSAEQIPAWRRASIQEAARTEMIAGKLQRAGVKEGRIGVDFLPFQVKDELARKAPGLQVVSIAEEILKARMVKSEDEIMLLEAAATNNEIGMRAALDAMVEGATEHEVIAAAVGAMARAGIEGITHYPGCRSGERTLQDYLPIGRRLRRGDTVIIDMGNYGPGGYASDFCRTGIVGRPSEQMKECYRALLRAHREGIAAVKPGAMASDVHAVINKALNVAGLPGSIYSNGHGIGMGMVELPTVGAREEIPEDIELQEGMTVCLEPITYIEEEGAAKLEDEVVVTADGCRLLTRSEYWDV